MKGFKTLVAKSDKTGIVVAVYRVGWRLKALAALAVIKRVIGSLKVQPLTGYIEEGIPNRLKNYLYLQKIAFDYDTILVVPV